MIGDMDTSLIHYMLQIHCPHQCECPDTLPREILRFLLVSVKSVQMLQIQDTDEERDQDRVHGEAEAGH